MSLAFSGFRPRVPWALALCVVCFVGLLRLSSLCALASFVFPAWPLAAPWWLLPPPPPPLLCLAASGCSVFYFSFRCAPPLSQLSPVFGPGCPGPCRCVLFVSRAAGCGAPCFASSGVVSRGAAVCGVFCAVPGVVWRAGVWSVLWWVLLSCFCCALLSCVAAFSAGFFFSWSLAVRGCCFGFRALPVRCGACVPAALLSVRCSLAPAALAGVLCCCLWCLCACCWAWLPSVVSCWVLAGPGVLFRCCAVVCPWVRCYVSCRLALRCCVLCCFVFLCSVLSRAVSSRGALSFVLWACVFGAVFCLVSPRCVCFAVVCCCLLLCFVPCASWGVVLCVPCPLRPVRCCFASLLSLGALLPCAVPRGAVLPCGVALSCPAALFVWFLLFAKPLQLVFFQKRFLI